MKPFGDYLSLYQQLGFAVIPAKHGQKRPSVEWRQYQEKGPTKKQVHEWFKDAKQNVAILCGEPSLNLVVLDFDDMTVYPKFFDTAKIESETLVVKTGSSKRHIYLRTEKPLDSFKIPQLGLEIRSNRNVVIAPPSLHPSGDHYEFLHEDVKAILTVPDLEEAVWRKAEELGIKKPRDFFSEHAKTTQGQSYLGRTPPCIVKICQGVTEGIRNEAGMRLAAYWLQFKRDCTPEQALKRLKSWNILNKPQLGTEELKSIVESASRLNRSYGCRQNQAWCDIERCSLKLGQLLTAEAEDEAENILNSDDVLASLKNHLENIMTGEENNKKLLFILLTSGIVDDPGLKQMILLKAESGAGKSHLMRLADAFKTKSVGRFTAHGLDYSDLWNYHILKLKEIGKMDQEFQGVSTIKFLSADDQGYIVETPIRGPDGRFTTTEYRIPPITVVTSTTRIEMDSQFERRAWILNPDESEDQTRKIAEWKAKHEREKGLVALGEEKETSYDHSLRVLKAVIRKLKTVNILLPYPKAITEIIGHSKLRLRGDYDKFFAVIELYGFLHQRTLPELVNPKGEKVVLATPKKALEILEIAEEPYQTMASGLEKRTRQLIEVLEELGLTTKENEITLFDRENVAVKLGKSEDTVYKYFKDWCRAGYLSEKRTRGKGNPVHFRFLYSLDTFRRKAIVSFGIDKNPTELLSKLRKEARETISSLSDFIGYGMGWSKEKILRLIESEIPIPQTPKSENEDNSILKPKHEKKQGIERFSETQQIEDDV